MNILTFSTQINRAIEATRVVMCETVLPSYKANQWTRSLDRDMIRERENSESIRGFVFTDTALRPPPEPHRIPGFDWTSE